MSLDAVGFILKAASVVSEVRLPWTMSQRLAHLHTEALRRYYDARVQNSAPFVTGEDNPGFEIHLLLGHNHVGMCLWAVKSFLHWAERKYTVVLHDDGSLSEDDIGILSRHLINVRIFKRAVADALVLERLQAYPVTRNYRLGSVGTLVRDRKLSLFAMKLLDFNLLSEARKVLVLDTDVLFFKKPVEIVNWIEHASDRECLYCFEQYVPVRNVRNKLVGFKRRDDDPVYFNSGLICFGEATYSLPMIEDWISSKNGVVQKVHTFEQFAYNHLVYSNALHRPLPDTYSFNYNDQNCVATHFGIKRLFFDNLGRIRSDLSA